MIEHTPGPWELRPTVVSGGEWFKWVYGPNNVPIVLMGSDSLPPTFDQVEANARLIAAAPELLEALKEVLAAQGAGEISYRSSDGRGYEAMLAVEAAIAKAEGRAS